MTNQIVTVNVSITNPPAPSTLLRTGALISQGGTSLTAGTYSLLTQYSDLTPLLATGQTITALTWLSSVATITVSGGHGFHVGDTFPIIVSGATPAGYNGTFNGTIASATTITYPLATNPGTATVFGKVTDGDVTELGAMATTYFAQGSSNSVYVLELGAGTAAEGVTALTTFINNNPQMFFSYLVPREWDAEPTFKTYTSQFTSPSAMVYFFITTTLATYAAWAALNNKSTFLMIEATGIPATEFSCAAPFYVTLNYKPSSANRVSPLCYAFLYGVTAYPTVGNAATLALLKAADVNIVATAAEGGLSNLMLTFGHMGDGNPFNYWYTVAWSIVNINLDLSNEIINGSNTTVNPLYYNPRGIDRLQQRAARTLINGVSYGLILGQVISVQLDTEPFIDNFNNGDYTGNAVINAVPFADYTLANPSDYQIGQYNGLTAIITPARGFEQIIFNLNVTNIA